MTGAEVPAQHTWTIIEVTMVSKALRRESRFRAGYVGYGLARPDPRDSGAFLGFREADCAPTILGSDTHLLTPLSLHSPHTPINP